jgi:hypothetical protein
MDMTLSPNASDFRLSASDCQMSQFGRLKDDFFASYAKPFATFAVIAFHRRVHPGCQKQFGVSVLRRE